MHLPAESRSFTCPIPQCSLSHPVTSRPSLQRHLCDRHGLVVAVGKEIPRQLETAPTFAADTSGRLVCPEVNCHQTFANTRTATDHWRNRRCKNGRSTPFGVYGSAWVTGNSMPLPREQHPFPSQQQPPPEPAKSLQVYGTPIAEVQQFTYLGRILSAEDDDSPAISARINLAASSFWALHRRFLAKKHISAKTKVAVVKSIIYARVIYGSETWLIKEHDEERLRALQQKLLRHATGMHPKMTPDGLRYPSRASVLQAAQEQDIIATIAQSQLRFVGHLLRRPTTEEAAHRILFSCIPGDGRVGFTDSNLLRHRILCRIESAGLSPADAGNRDKWREATRHFDPHPPQPGPAGVPSSVTSLPLPPPKRGRHTPTASIPGPPHLLPKSASTVRGRKTQ